MYSLWQYTKDTHYRLHSTIPIRIPSIGSSALAKYGEFPDNRLTLSMRGTYSDIQLDTLFETTPKDSIDEIYFYLEDMFYFSNDKFSIVEKLYNHYGVMPRVFYCALGSKAAEEACIAPRIEYFFWYLIELSERIPQRLKELPIVDDPEYKLSCFNLTCTNPRQHKLVVASYLNKDTSYITHHHYDDNDVADAIAQIAKYGKHLDKLIDGLEYITSKKSPGHMDRFNVSTRLDVTQGDFMLAELSNSCVSIVTETLYFYDFASPTEKSIKPAAVKRPFVLVSNPGSLKLMKGLGFKTFDRWWDESYDLETDHYKRLDMIFKVIDQLEAMSLEELYDMLDEMEEVLEHNQKNVINLYESMKKFNEQNWHS